MRLDIRSWAQRRRSAVPGRVLHLTSAHPWTDNRIYRREAISLQTAGFDVGLYAVDNGIQFSTPLRVSKITESRRLSRITLGTIKAFRVAISSRAELVHLHDPEMIWTIPFLRLFGSRVIYDAHEDLPSQVMDKAYLPQKLRLPTAWVSRCLVAFAGRHSDWIVAATDRIASRFDPEKTTVVRNFPYAPVPNKSISKPSDRDTVAVYVGGISAARGAMALVDAFGSDSLPNGWLLEMAGDVAPDYLERLKQRPGWRNVRFHGRVSPTRARELVASARVGICTLKNTVAYRDSLPTKMFEYMAEGVPVIASNFPLWRTIVRGNDCGILVDPDSPEEIVGAINRYLHDECLLDEHGKNGFNAAKRSLNWDNEVGKLIDAYRGLI